MEIRQRASGIWGASDETWSKAKTQFLARDGDEVADGARNGSERSDVGIDEGAKNAGGEGLSRGRGALEDKDRERAVGAHGSEQPGQAADPGGSVGQIETGAESA